MASRHFFRVSEAVALALHSTAIMAEYNDGSLMSNKELAEMQKASRNHLSKVLQRLVHIGIVSSTRGPGGGFKLAKKPKDICLLDIYEAIEGPMNAAGCLFEQRVCEGPSCILGDFITDLEKQTIGYLKKTNMKTVLKTFHMERPKKKAAKKKR